jgi:hypothetical protein
MSKHTNRIPPALKHGIYSGIGLLPTEDPAEFQKFKQEIFDEYVPVGRSERNIVKNMACKMWRRQNLFTLCLAERAMRAAAIGHPILAVNAVLPIFGNSYDTGL